MPFFFFFSFLSFFFPGDTQFVHSLFRSAVRSFNFSSFQFSVFSSPPSFPSTHLLSLKCACILLVIIVIHFRPCEVTFSVVLYHLHCFYLQIFQLERSDGCSRSYENVIQTYLRSSAACVLPVIMCSVMSYFMVGDAILTNLMTYFCLLQNLLNRFFPYR